mgnify:CR=1 FL=1
MKLIIFFIVNICFATDTHLVLKTKLRQFTYEAYGKLKPQQMSEVASKVNGQVTSRYVKIGQLITKGQILFQLDPGTLPLEIRQIEFEIEKQQLQLAHHQGRYNRRTRNPDAYTEEGLELEKLQIDKIKLEIKKLSTKKSIHQLRLDYKTIRAPFDGVVTGLFKEIGDWVMLGGSTLTMQSFNVWRLETEVPWDVYSQVQIGDVVIVRKAGIKHKVEIIAKVPVSNPKTGQFRLELTFTSEKILTLDWIEGVSIREKEILKNKKINIEVIATDIIQHFLRHAVRDGFFHADMHQGNLFIDDNGQIIPIDFGIMGRMDKLNRRYLAEILYGFVQRDYKKVAEVHIIAGLVPNNVNVDELAQALRSIGEPIFGQSVKDISGGKLLKQLFDITEKFNMQTQPQLLLLQKTMVVVEGVARKLNPNTNIWETSKPVLEKWLKETKDPVSNLTETLKDSAEVLKKLPELPKIMDKANQALTFLASGQIPQNSNSYSALKDKELEMKSFRNQSIIGLLLLVFLSFIVF